MFCPQCGVQIPDESSFCPMCGGTLSAPPAPATIPQESQTPAPPAPPVAPPPPLLVAPQAPAPPVAAQPSAAPIPFAPAVASGTIAIPYAKAPLGSRFLAVLVDGLIATALLPAGVILVAASVNSEDTPVLGLILLAVGGLWQVAYMLGRDISGAGWGKRLSGLVVVATNTGGIAHGGSTVLRQVVFYALNLIPVIGSLVEPVMVLVDKDGRRVGDKAAKTQVVRASEAASRGLAVPMGKGAAIAALVVALLLSLAGGVVGGVVAARTLAGGDVSDFAAELAATQPVEEPQAEVPPQDITAEETAPQEIPVEGAVNPETAVDAVGNLLNNLKENDVAAARSYATRRFQEDESWFFAPAGGALASFEVTDVYADQAVWVVEVSEDWNSGPQKSRYFVIEEDNTARVDGVEFLD